MMSRHLPELFDQAAREVFDLVTEVDTIIPRESRWLQVTADDEQALMRKWVGELLYVFDTESTLFSRAETEIRRTDSGSLQLDGHLWGEAFDPDRHPLRGTLHSDGATRVWSDGDGWHACLALELQPLAAGG